mgnify:CR=1 FL=1
MHRFAGWLDGMQVKLWRSHVAEGGTAVQWWLAPGGVGLALPSVPLQDLSS